MTENKKEDKEKEQKEIKPKRAKTRGDPIVELF